MTARNCRRAAMVWVACYTWMFSTYAAMPTLSEEVLIYDYGSLMWAALFGFMGGVGGTIVTLMSDNTIVLNVWKQMLRDLIVSLIGGALIYVVFLWLQTISPDIFNKELRILAIVIAGASKGRWKDVVTGFVARGISNAATKILGAPPKAAETPPPSVATPLSDK